ncbi:MAG: hypothetical protein KBA53_01825 [Thermoclostridium sp.]|nr:hypothetical protein [Thermoclostridium sp.]
MSKSRVVIISTAFLICVLLFSLQWKPDAKPAAIQNNTVGNEQQELLGTPLVPAELYEKVNGKTPDEVLSALSPYQFEFNRDLYPNNEIMQTNLYRNSLLQSTDDIYLLELGQTGINWHYIILCGNSKAVTYKGSIILPGQAASGQDFRIIEDPISGTVWVVMKELAGHGTGISQYNEVWYRVSDKLIVKDLQYIVKMHQWMSLSQLVFYAVDGKVSTQNHVNIYQPNMPQFYVDVQYQLQFHDSSALTMADEWDAFLFNANRNVRYVWNADEKRFYIDSSQSTGDPSLFDFSKQGLLKNFKNELGKLEKSEVKLKQDWLLKVKGEFPDLKRPEVVENLNTIEIMNMNDDKNASVVLTLPEGFSVKKLAFPKAPNFEYQAEKNKAIDTVYSFEIHSMADKSKFRFYGTEGLAGWFYDTNYYRKKPDTERFPSHSSVKAKVYEGDTILGKGELFVLECDILSEELKTEEFSTYELVYAWVPIENEELAYNLSISVPLGEGTEKYVEMAKTILQIQ